MTHLSHFKLPESTEFNSVECDAVLLGKLLMTFHRQSFETSGPNHSVTQHHFPEVLSPQYTAARTSNLTLPECISAVQEKEWLVHHTWLQSFIQRVMDIDQDRACFRTLFDHLEASHKESQPAFQLKLIKLHCNNGFGSKFKQYNVLNFHTFLQTNI